MASQQLEFDTLLSDIRRCTLCAADLPFGPRPVVQAGLGARILIIGQAPGRKVHESGVPWRDDSGDRLRDWMGIDIEQFYDPDKIAIMPMGFCYPGPNPKGGGDLPPMRRCAPTWHERLRSHLPHVGLTLVVGRYAQTHYLDKRLSLGETVRGFRDHLPAILPLPHPSWRVVRWMELNPWYEADLLPVLRQRVRDVLGTGGQAG